MKKVNPLIAAAFLVHAVAWFLPVAKDGVTFPDGLLGWEACYYALFLPAAALFHEGVFSASSAPLGVLSALSAMPTALFVLGAWWVVAKGTSETAALLRGSPGCAFVVNAHWLRFSVKFGLRIGYYLWRVSFLLLAIGLLRQSGATASGFESNEDLSRIDQGHSFRVSRPSANWDQRP